MTTWYLVNALLIGTQKFLPGHVIDDTVNTVASVTAAGGELWPATDGLVAAAAAAVALAHANRGISEAEMESRMRSATEVSLRTNGRVARGVVIANIASLAAFTVANNGITYQEGDTLIAALQTTVSECGPWVVGPVAAGVAALTRPNNWAHGTVIPQGTAYGIGPEGTAYKGSSWKAMCAAGKIVDTDDPLFYPKEISGTLTLAAGTYTLGATELLFLFATGAPSRVGFWQDTPVNTALTTEYCCPVLGRTAGKSGTGAATIRANIAAGTINVADISTLGWEARNW